MKITKLLVALSFLFAVSTAQAGEMAVTGSMQATYINSNTASQRIYLNMGREYPNHTFTGLIWYSSNKDNFDGRPDRKYKKKNICISGVITTYNEKPQIQIDFENQIEIR